MAITIDYSPVTSYTIQIPRADLTLISSSPTEVRQLNIDELRLELHDLQDDALGIWAPTAFVHTPPLTISGVTLARTVEILDPYVIEFEDGNYNVNIVGGNSNVSDVTVKNQVGVNTANSAGLQDPYALQAAAFTGGSVAVDTTSSYSGTTFPIGTRAFPVNNIADAHIIADDRGLNTFALISAITLSGESLTDGYVFVGDSPTVTVVTIDPSADLTNAEFVNCTVQGTLDGNNVFRQCVVLDITFFNGFLFQSALAGKITLGGGVQANIFSCYSGVAGGGLGQYAEVDFNGAEANSLALRDYYGGIYLSNAGHASTVASVDMSSGRVIVENTVTEGALWIRGVADVTDGSAGNAIVYDQTNKKETAKEVIPHVWAARK